MEEYRFLYYDPYTQRLESFDAYFSDINVYQKNIEKCGIKGLLAKTSDRKAMKILADAKRKFEERIGVV